MSVDAGIRYTAPPGAATDAGVAGFLTSTGSASYAAISTRIGALVTAPAPLGAGQDDTANLEAGMSALSALGGGRYRMRAGVYVINGELDIPLNVWCEGMGRNVTILQSPAAAPTNPMVRFHGDYSIATDMTFDLNGRAASIGVVFESAAPPLNGSKMLRCRIINTTNNAARFTTTFTNISLEDNIVEACAAGFSAQAAGALAGQYVRVVNNTFNNVGGNVLQFFNNAGANTYRQILIEGNIFHNLQAAAIPVEVGSCTGLACVGNIMDSGTRGFSIAKCVDATITGNTVSNQTIYFVENNGNTRLTVSGNTVENCAQFMSESSQSTDTVVTGNTATGTGLAGSTAVPYIGFLQDTQRARITDNVFDTAPYCAQGFIRFGGAAANPAVDVTIENNTFIISDPNDSIIAISLRRVSRCLARNNKILINRATVGPGGSNDDIVDVIIMTLDAVSGYIGVVDNVIEYNASVAATPNHAGIGHGSTGAAALPGLRVMRNEVINGNKGTRLTSVTSADQVVDQNMSRTCATPVDSFNAAAIFVRQAREVDGSAIPTTGTWQKGDHIRNTAGMAVGSPKGWYCTVAGTPGTWVSEGNL